MGVTKRRKNQKMKPILMPFDVFERHKIIAESIDDKATILDVGGGLDALGQFIIKNGNKIVVSNLKSGDVKADGRNLPFNDNSFDIVTSIDVLEHVPVTDRKRFIYECLRVASKKVIISTPLGNKGHIQAEKDLLVLLKKKGFKSTYLEEHVERGLPTLKELSAYSVGLAFKLVCTGNYRLNIFLTKMDVTSLKNSKLDKIFYLGKRLFNLILNLFYFPFIKLSAKEDTANRVYLFIEKNKQK